MKLSSKVLVCLIMTILRTHNYADEGC